MGSEVSGKMNDLRPVAWHRMALRISTRVTTNIRRMYHRKAANVQPHEVIKVLNKAKIKFVLMGLMAFQDGWKSRATQDVDVLIQAQHKKAVQALRKAFPNLIVHDRPIVTRFVDPSNNLEVIDLIKPQAEIHKAVPKNTFNVGASYRIPDLEMALALKYAAMIAPHRTRRKRRLDEADLIGMVTKNYEIIDKEKLFRLGEIVKHGGGRELVQMVEDSHRLDQEEDFEPEG